MQRTWCLPSVLVLACLFLVGCETRRVAPATPRDVGDVQGFAAEIGVTVSSPAEVSGGDAAAANPVSSEESEADGASSGEGSPAGDAESSGDTQASGDSAASG